MITFGSRASRVTTFALVSSLTCTAIEKRVAGDELLYSIVNGKPHAAIRYRFEEVEQKPLAKDAIAHTLRVRAGYTTGEFRGF